MDSMLIFWIAFIATFVIVYSIDLYVTDHRRGTISVKESLMWTGLWMTVALLFGLAVYLFFPQNPDSTVRTASVMGIKFVSGYFTEYSLSIDNLFVFILIFSMMGINQQNQPKLLKLGILIAIVLRILFILVGMELIQRFHWILYILGVVLIYTSYKMIASKGEDSVDPTNNFLYKIAIKWFQVDPDVHNPKFFSKINGKTHITNMFLTLLVIGTTDIVFAIDSIPAIIGVIMEGSEKILTLAEENFLAITSNVFAVMGLISLFFALRGIVGMFRFLKYGISVILFFIGAKMLLGAIPAVSSFFAANSWFSLAVIIATLIVSIVLSKLIPEKQVKETIETSDNTPEIDS
ncbi:MAG TPA: tellurium resistance protein TerC [Porphyromonadaceae bacterium]|jgi:tellurite resistance protein TerC|uniref:TerC/Alx family metal homeostasis membrane protein n=1 Tax=Limibacterium fermenti TaxID=3229863 RepID=UPI000E7E750E|nr:tellurium resistance protein TerC [Porphyromonadaceae bacterium]HBL33580.1 tellurium resistance protein TerC [Porphyromonadaceae bacterium]HBX21618.1 tellurium resistance protein TerC [Porphyromonadaceae bacterium]HBX45724.1 tellurium resistance protein TerC [Porphyromonadaceae bacterium]HCM20385.1 tellurium resistance protein TerC [Porphyromonadaceae bacterium]